MPIVISDTLTGTKRELVPVDPGKIRFYACGPTVYDSAHVGHGRSYVVWDLVVRHLRARGYEVRYVRNFTDVDDKIIRRANERGEDPMALAARYAAEFDDDMDALGNLRPDVAPTVSEHVPQIVSMIATLVEKGFAYPAANGDVYYSVRAFPDYGRLAKRNVDDLLAGARVETGEAKRDPLDFALWKAAKPSEPAWDSPWGRGRPGWHIECSAMTLAHLGVPIDLHGGGKDLVFPHHTNEIAQSAAAVGDGRTAESFCRHWMHHGFVEIDSEKMSKSLGNFFTLRDVLAKFDAEGVRLFFLGTHYRNPINYSDAILVEAERRLNYFYETLDKVDALAAGSSPAGEGGAVVEDARRALDDDFNAPQVLAVLAEAFTAANALADKRGKKTPEERARLAAFARDVREIGTTLGIVQRRPAEALRAIRAKAAARRGIVPAEVEAKLVERADARKAKDFARSDAIRDALLSDGVAIMDGPQGTTWKVE
jgi:cysteinyl-tRNA synthetase